eukprot:2946701-Rhodomonas_salina.1
MCPSFGLIWYQRTARATGCVVLSLRRVWYGPGPAMEVFLVLICRTLSYQSRPAWYLCGERFRTSYGLCGTDVARCGVPGDGGRGGGECGSGRGDQRRGMPAPGTSPRYPPTRVLCAARYPPTRYPLSSYARATRYPLSCYEYAMRCPLASYA